MLYTINTFQSFDEETFERSSNHVTGVIYKLLFEYYRPRIILYSTQRVTPSSPTVANISTRTSKTA